MAYENGKIKSYSSRKFQPKNRRNKEWRLHNYINKLVTDNSGQSQSFSRNFSNKNSDRKIIIEPVIARKQVVQNLNDEMREKVLTRMHNYQSQMAPEVARSLYTTDFYADCLEQQQVQRFTEEDNDYLFTPNIIFPKRAGA